MPVCVWLSFSVLIWWCLLFLRFLCLSDFIISYRSSFHLLSFSFSSVSFSLIYYLLSLFLFVMLVCLLLVPLIFLSYFLSFIFLFSYLLSLTFIFYCFFSSLSFIIMHTHDQFLFFLFHVTCTLQ